MKRLSLAIIFACCTLAMAAQEGFRVDYQGARPTIKDFVNAYLTSILSEEVEECDMEGIAIYKSLQRAITSKEKGLPLDENVTLTIDTKNGFLVYEQKYEDYLSRIEMCYWNEADGKHKLFADNRWSFWPDVTHQVSTWNTSTNPMPCHEQGRISSSQLGMKMARRHRRR